jgi:sigma-B regulation protein RsbU (phosphoserine phosphatase)
MSEPINNHRCDKLDKTLIPDPNDAQLFYDLLEIMGFVVIERIGPAGFRIIGNLPEWFVAIFGDGPSSSSTLAPEHISPFVDNFFPIAQQFWAENKSGMQRSGPWTETDKSGNDHHLEISAVSLGKKHILLLQLLGQAYQEKKDLLQQCREQGLDYEILFKTQQALNHAHDLLLTKQRKLDEDMSAAADIQSRFLPKDLTRIGNVEIAYKFNPCSSIAGDMFNVVRLDEYNVAIYLLDVSGHGAAAAMMAVSVCQMLPPWSSSLVEAIGEDSCGFACVEPREMLEALDKEFPLERFDKYFTIFYGVFNLLEGVLTYSNAGHPPPLLVHADGSIDRLDKGGTIIGLEGIIPFEQEKRILKQGDRIILYSDGVTELSDSVGNLFGMDRLINLLKVHRNEPLGSLADTIQRTLIEYSGSDELQDDMSLLAIEITGLSTGPAFG